MENVIRKVAEFLRASVVRRKSRLRCWNFARTTATTPEQPLLLLEDPAALFLFVAVPLFRLFLFLALGSSRLTAWIGTVPESDARTPAGSLPPRVVHNHVVVVAPLRPRACHTETAADTSVFVFFFPDTTRSSNNSNSNNASGRSAHRMSERTPSAEQVTQQHTTNTQATHRTSASSSSMTTAAAVRTSTQEASSSSSKRLVDTSLATTSGRCVNPVSEVNGRLDTQVEVKVYPCNNSQNGNSKKKCTTFTVKPEGVIIQGSNRNRTLNNDLGAEYAAHIGRKLQRYELSDTRACQLLVTTHAKSFWVVPAPEAFSRHSGTCRLLGDRKHPPAAHTLQVGDFLRVGSVGVVVIETHNGVENRVLSEERIQKIMKDTTSGNGGFLDLAETDGENSDDESMEDVAPKPRTGDKPVCYMCFDEEHGEGNPLITPCKCSGDTKYVHVECLRKWHTAEADNQICFLSSVDATCSVCKSTFKSDFKLGDGRHVKLFKSSLEPPYVSLLVATKHEMAQRLFNTRFQLSFSTILKPDGRNGNRPLLLGRSSGSDMVLDYRTVSARHSSIRFKNGEFIFTDAGSSNGSYLYLRRPVELTAAQPVQFRLGRSMISMKVVSKWNRRLLRAVGRRGQSSSTVETEGIQDADEQSIGSNDDDVRIVDGRTGSVARTVHRRRRESIMRSLPAHGQLSQQSRQHLDLLYALAYPKRSSEKDLAAGRSRRSAASKVAEIEGESLDDSTETPADRPRSLRREASSSQEA